MHILLQASLISGQPYRFRALVERTAMWPRADPTAGGTTASEAPWSTASIDGGQEASPSSLYYDPSSCPGPSPLYFTGWIFAILGAQSLALLVILWKLLFSQAPPPPRQEVIIREVIKYEYRDRDTNRSEGIAEDRAGDSLVAGSAGGAGKAVGAKRAVGAVEAASAATASTAASSSSLSLSSSFVAPPACPWPWGSPVERLPGQPEMDEKMRKLAKIVLPGLLDLFPNEAAAGGTGGTGGSGSAAQPGGGGGGSSLSGGRVPRLTLTPLESYATSRMLRGSGSASALNRFLDARNRKVR